MYRLQEPQPFGSNQGIDHMSESECDDLYTKSWPDSQHEECDSLNSQPVAECASPADPNRGKKIKNQSEVEEEEIAAILLICSGYLFFLISQIICI